MSSGNWMRRIRPATPAPAEPERLMSLSLLLQVLQNNLGMTVEQLSDLIREEIRGRDLPESWRLKDLQRTLDMLVLHGFLVQKNRVRKAPGPVETTYWPAVGILA